MLILNAKVSIKVVNDLPQVIVNKQYKKIFNKDSNVYKIFKTKGIKHLISLLNNGYFFIIDDTIVDFRYNNYDGFICTNTQKLLNLFGYIKNPSYYLRKGFHANNVNEYLLLSFKHKTSLVYEAYYNDPDKFEIGMSYYWNPFQNFVKGTPYFKYLEFYYFADEYDKIPLGELKIIDEDISEYIKAYFIKHFDRLSETKINDISDLKMLAKMNNDIEGYEFFESLTSISDYSNYDALIYLMELSQDSEQFGHGFKTIKKLFNS